MNSGQWGSIYFFGVGFCMYAYRKWFRPLSAEEVEERERIIAKAQSFTFGDYDGYLTAHTPIAGVCVMVFAVIFFIIASL